MLLLDVQEHEVRLNGSSKSHCPTGVRSLELSLFMNDGVVFEMELRDELLLKKEVINSPVNRNQVIY